MGFQDRRGIMPQNTIRCSGSPARLSPDMNVLKIERRIMQLEAMLDRCPAVLINGKGSLPCFDTAHCAKIKKKIHTLRKELCVLDPSRKKPDCWTLISIMKFVRTVRAKVAETRSYLSNLLCCSSCAVTGRLTDLDQVTDLDEPTDIDQLLDSIADAENLDAGSDTDSVVEI